MGFFVKRLVLANEIDKVRHRFKRIIEFVGNGCSQASDGGHLLRAPENLLVAFAFCDIHDNAETMGLASLVVIQLPTFTQPHDLPIRSEQPEFDVRAALTKQPLDCRVNFRFVFRVNYLPPALKFSIRRKLTQCG